MSSDRDASSLEWSFDFYNIGYKFAIFVVDLLLSFFIFLFLAFHWGVPFYLSSFMFTD